ncbi:MAG: SDR family oxidoreductase [Bacteroidota bacterium]|nr:SDR family oxidoreductase [Bacteroidota bacterium]
MERRNIVVLGGSSGIGRAIAQRFAKEGCRVMVGSNNQALNDETLLTLVGKGHKGFVVDVSLESEVASLKEFVSKQFGTIDVLVNSVGISKGAPMLNSDYNYWHQTVAVMFYGAIYTTKALVPLMPDNSRIINITSIHHDRVEMNSSAYGMCKAAITQLTKSLAVELASKNILANCIAPGFVNTPMSIKADGVNELEKEWFKDNYIKYNHLPLKRAGQPKEVAGVAWFLAGPDASYITGSVITVDGGLTITF